MFEQYSEKARRAILFAYCEAVYFNSSVIESEHLLLGILREGNSAILRNLGPEISWKSVREQVGAPATTQGEGASAGGQLPFSGECKRVLDYTLEEARELQNKLAESEHLLLGLLREENCRAAQLLQKGGVTLLKLRKEIALAQSWSTQKKSDRELIATGLVSQSETAPFGDRREQTRASVMLYTEKARCALFFARFEASQFGSFIIETEHLLLGLLRESTVHLLLFKDPASVFSSIRHQIERNSKQGSEIPMSIDLPLSDELKRVLQFGEEEAQLLNVDSIGPEHLLLGVLREDSCFAAQVLRERGIDIGEIRKKLTIHNLPLIS